jgi:hypothetical protein
METPMDVRHPSLKRAAVGAVFVLAGSLALSGLVWATYGDSAACQAWSVRLGLGGATLISGVAQTLVLLGLWQFWRAFQAKPD